MRPTACAVVMARLLRHAADCFGVEFRYLQRLSRQEPGEAARVFIAREQSEATPMSDPRDSDLYRNDLQTRRDLRSGMSSA